MLEVQRQQYVMPVTNMQHLTHLSGLEVILDTVLEAFAFDLHGCDDQRIPKKMSRIPNSFIGFKTLIKK